MEVTVIVKNIETKQLERNWLRAAFLEAALKKHKEL
jgi:hypothetical protein